LLIKKRHHENGEEKSKNVSVVRRINELKRENWVGVETLKDPFNILPQSANFYQTKEED
jgi:hypothetical protein